MIEIFGGLWLENLVKQDMHYELMRKLLEIKLIQGVQLRVAHPIYTPDLSTGNSKKILDNWPGKLIVHIGAENAGVDLGEQFDETSEFQSKSKGENWSRWNEKTFEQSLQIAKIESSRLVAHPGYGTSHDDQESLKKIIKFLQRYKKYGIALENVPPIVQFKKDYWGFGGTPRDMKRLFQRLGGKWKCLIDWTHLIIAHNQANFFNSNELQDCKNIEKLIEGYLLLPHLDVCHYSGSPPREIVIDNHSYLDNAPHELILEALKNTKTVCLEIKFNNFDQSHKEIENFKNFLE